MKFAFDYLKSLWELSELVTSDVGDRNVKVLGALSALCVNVAPIAALASCPTIGCRAAPAPLIGAGLPVAFSVAGVLLAFAIWKRVSARR